MAIPKTSVNTFYITGGNNPIKLDMTVGNAQPSLTSISMDDVETDLTNDSVISLNLGNPLSGKTLKVRCAIRDENPKNNISIVTFLLSGGTHPLPLDLPPVTITPTGGWIVYTYTIDFL